MKIALKPFVGQHCETTATGTLLKQLGIELSEPMLFGLGEGLGFIIWNMKTMEYPFGNGKYHTESRFKTDGFGDGLKTKSVANGKSVVRQRKSSWTQTGLLSP